MNDPIKTLSEPGGRGRAACAKVAEAGPELVVALKRALPFFARKRLPISPEPPRCQSFAALAADGSIVYTSAWNEKNVGVRGLVLFDEAALARVLDGVLGGGDATKLPSLKLTSAQLALSSRVTGAILRAFAEAISAKLGLQIEPTQNKEIDAGMAVVIPLAVEGGGRISIAFPLACIRAEETAETEEVDEDIAAALLDVDVDVVAELGKIRLSLEAIARLKVGDVVRLSLPLDERARVSAGGSVLFHGRPTASGDVVAVALERKAA